MKNVLVVPIIVSLTVIVLAVISQQVTMALYFLPLNNTLINQEGENMTNQTTTPLPTPSHVSNQTTTPLPTPSHVSNQTTTPLPTPSHVSNQTTTPLPLPTSPTASTPVSNQTTISNNPSLLSYISHIQIQDILSIKSYKIW